MSTLNEFIAYVKNGVAKNNKFLVNLTLPEDLADMKDINMRKVLLFCDQAAIPGVSFASAPIRSYGETRELPYEKLYEQITLSFYLDAKLTIKTLFDRWIQLVQDPVSRDFTYPKDYKTHSIEILVGNVEGEQVYKCVLYNCFPKAIAPIQLDYSGKDVMKLSVTMSYEYYTTHQISSSSNVPAVADPIARNTAMAPFNYGYKSEIVVPQTYYDAALARLTAEQVDSVENVGEYTGYGEIFNG